MRSRLARGGRPRCCSRCSSLAQLLLPRIAASRISSRVGRYGHVQHVDVSAWPAVKLLWGDADSVTVRAGRLALSPAEAAALLREGSGVSKLDVSAERVRVGPLGADRRDPAEARRAAERPGRRDAGRGSGGARRGRHGAAARQRSGTRARAGRGQPVRRRRLGARASPKRSDGALVAHPEGFLLEGFRLTLFSNPHVHVEGVAASVAEQQPAHLPPGISALLR